MNRIRGAAIALAIAFIYAGSATTMESSKRMADGKQWTTQNLNVDIAGSYCYDNADGNCVKYGRLYTWESAQKVCASLGTGWRLPAETEWRQLAKHYGGIFEDSKDDGKGAYTSLMTGGPSGFNAVLGGGRAGDGEYARGEAHGFYWTASENGAGHAYFYNFGKGRPALYRQDKGEKERAFSVRCVKD